MVTVRQRKAVGARALQPVWSTSKSKPSAIAAIGRGSPNAEPIKIAQANPSHRQGIVERRRGLEDQPQYRD